MWKAIAAGLIAFAVAGAAIVHAQQPAAKPAALTWTAEDSAALVEARIASLKAGLKLKADQEKNWPQVESALRDNSKDRAAQLAKMRTAAQSNDPVALLRARADAMNASAVSIRKLADAAEPLYKSLDDSQKRRMAVLIGGRARR